MHLRSTGLAASIAVAMALSAGLLAAQPFEQTVNKTFDKDGAFLIQTSALKQSIDRSSVLFQDQSVLDPQQAQAEEAALQYEALGHPGGGGHPPGGGHQPPSGGHQPPSGGHPPPGGGHQPPPGGHHPPPDGGHRPPPNGGHHPPPDGGHHPPPNGGHHPGHPGNPGRPGHPHPRPDHRGGDWGRWHGHPGWGHRWDRWEWRNGYPYWWGWVIWRGERRAQCLSYYDALHTQCNGACEDEHESCVESCSAFGDPSCVEQCTANSDYCFDSCQREYDARSATCPAWVR